jgi:hypothetical protein
LVNAGQIKAVPGRKTDIKDAQWIGELLQHRLFRPSFIPGLLTSPLPFPQPLLWDNSSYILCAFCQKNFFFATKLHKKKIIVVGEID